MTSAWPPESPLCVDRAGEQGLYGKAQARSNPRHVPESCTTPWWSAQGWGLRLAEVLPPARRQGQGQGQVPAQEVLLPAWRQGQG